MNGGSFGERIALCGLSHAETASYIGVSVPTIRSWSSRRRTVPETAMMDLAELWVLILRSDRIVDRWGRDLPAGAVQRRKVIQAALRAADLPSIMAWLAEPY